MSDSKQLSNPISTGDGGGNFENKVQAIYVVLMLSGGIVPCIRPWPIKKIKLQGKYAGYQTDDFIVFSENVDTGEVSKLLAQIKRKVSFTKNSKVLGDVLFAAYNDFNNPEVFNSKYDKIALITGPLSATDTTGVRSILDLAQHCENSYEFFTKVNKTKFSSKAKMGKLEVFRHHLKAANHGSVVSDEKLWEFLKIFHILGYDLDFKEGTSLSFVKTILAKVAGSNATNLWSMICVEVSSFNQNAGTIIPSNVDAEILDLIKVFRTAQQGHSEVTDGDESQNEHKELNLGQHPDYLLLSVFLGSWDEKMAGDVAVVDGLLKCFGISKSDWLKEMQELSLEENSPVTQLNAIWRIRDRSKAWLTLASTVFDNHLDDFKNVALTILKELDPRFDLEPEKRFAASIYGKELQYSNKLRRGIVGTLAIDY